MSTRSTMSSRWLLVVLSVLVLSVPTRASETLPSRSITVSGEAEREVMPDRAYLSLTVEVRQLTVEGARAEANRRIDAVLRLLSELKIPKSDIDSTVLEVRPEFAWNPQTGTQRLQGYLVLRSVRVKLADLDKLGALLERGMSAGANQISAPTFTHSRRETLLREVLGTATLDARRNAEAAAAGIGMTVGAAQRIEILEDGGGPQPMMLGMVRAAAVSDAAAEASYQPAQLTLKARVRATFDLAP